MISGPMLHHAVIKRRMVQCSH